MSTNAGALRREHRTQGPTWPGFAVLVGLILVTAGIAVQLEEPQAPSTTASISTVGTLPVSVAAVQHRGDFHEGTVKLGTDEAFVPTHGLNDFHPGLVRVGPVEAWAPAHGAGAFLRGGAVKWGGGTATEPSTTTTSFRDDPAGVPRFGRHT